MTHHRLRRCGPWSQLTDEDQKKIREAMDAAEEAAEHPERVDPKTRLTDRQLFVAAAGGPKP